MRGGGSFHAAAAEEGRKKGNRLLLLLDDPSLAEQLFRKYSRTPIYSSVFVVKSISDNQQIKTLLFSGARLEGRIACPI